MLSSSTDGERPPTNISLAPRLQVSRLLKADTINTGVLSRVPVYSSKLMETILKDAFDEGMRFRVIMVDSRPKANGVKGLADLVALGIKVTYVLINSISYVMKEATKVFLTAHALLANGYVMSRIGSSVISMMARAYNVPVLVVCETYKVSTPDPNEHPPCVWAGLAG